MKNYLIISKRKVKRFILAGLVPVLSICSIVFSSVFAVKVKADATSVTLGNDSYGTWSATTTIPIGNISNTPLSVALPTNSYLVPFEMDMQGGFGFNLNIYGVSIPIYLTDGTYFYQGEGSYSSGIRLQFPVNMSLKRISGTVTIVFRFAPQLRFYQSYDKAYKIPSSKIIDQSYRYEVSLGDFSYDGCFASLVRTGTSGFYYLNLTFDDFLIPTMDSSLPSKALFIPINLGVKFQLSVAAGTYTIMESSGNITGYVVPMTEAEVLTSPSFGSTSSANLSGPSFINSNDYYTILHALADSQFLTTEASDVALLKNLLSSWLGSSDPSSIPVNFANFATTLLTYISQIKSGMLSESDIQSITTSLNDLVTLQGSQVDLLQNILDLLSDWELSSIQSELISGTADDLSDAVDEEHQIFSNSLNTFKSSLGQIIDTYGDIDWVDYGAEAESFITLLEDFMWAAGPLYLVVAVVLLGGILLRIFGRVR